MNRCPTCQRRLDLSPQKIEVEGAVYCCEDCLPYVPAARHNASRTASKRGGAGVAIALAVLFLLVLLAVLYGLDVLPIDGFGDA